MGATDRSAAWRKPAGGITAVKIISIRNVADVRFSRNGAECVFLELHDPSEAAGLPLADDESSYNEAASSTDGIVSVLHTLTVVMSAEEAGRALGTEFMDEATAEGVIALVTAESGRRLLVGWSERFGGEQPLRLCSFDVRSGVRPSDSPIAEAVFCCEDTSLAAEY